MDTTLSERDIYRGATVYGRQWEEGAYPAHTQHLPPLNVLSCQTWDSLPAWAQPLFLPGLSFSSCQGSAFLPAWTQPPCLPGPSPSFCQGPTTFSAWTQPLFLPELSLSSCQASASLPARAQLLFLPKQFDFVCSIPCTSLYLLCQTFAEGNVPLIKIIRISSLNRNPGTIKAYMSSPGHLGAALGWEILN